LTTTRIRKPSPLLSLLAAGFVLLAVLLGRLGAATPTAHADAIDDEFLGALRAKGIAFGSSQAALIAAHEVCDELGLGRTPVQVASDVMKNSNLDAFHAGYFVGASIRAYCPRYAS
jgi:hypothetical protein